MSLICKKLLVFSLLLLSVKLGLGMFISNYLFVLSVLMFCVCGKAILNFIEYSQVISPLVDSAWAREFCCMNLQSLTSQCLSNYMLLAAWVYSSLFKNKCSIFLKKENTCFIFSWSSPLESCALVP